MSNVRRIQSELFSEDASARRKGRRARRQQKLYSQIREAISEVQEASNERTAHIRMNDQERGASRKIFGHPAVSSSLYVSETLGEFDVHGTLSAKFSGMNRSAGQGAHGITDGTINVSVELKPLHGVVQIVDVPVTVKNGYMLQPGMMYHQGTPYIISQSAIDELMDSATFYDDFKPDRAHMYANPKESGGAFPRELVASQQIEARQPRIPLEMINPTKEKARWENEQAQRQQDELKAKERRKQTMRDRNLSQSLSAESEDDQEKQATLSIDVLIPDTNVTLKRGSVVTIISTYDDLTHVRDQSGIEVLLPEGCLD